ncbi:GNAT family N-acetyltransferase [Undibacterium cyanobacteriorum]|uniref:GNAT family N-acetyltransferase n=1 Tax=Undibacterium cyanobacteriorum TaxID=3073561 RepID=A0ABY9RHW5_9BURK|nr:GNAT family N-acetyltransferase [Undibacterium sp. 20NA77.5]WMW80827.1 GNAT family N-acetyltransferase [Undibacterium sp. 20NA77.5]
MQTTIKHTEDFQEAHIRQLHALYQEEWWTRGRSLEETQACIAGSTLCIGLADDHDKLIGFVRVLSDLIFKAMIFDVIVDPSQRGQGLGDQLLRLVKQHPRLQKVKHFELYCLPTMQAFYERHGFSDELGDIQLMLIQQTPTSNSNKLLNYLAI